MIGTMAMTNTKLSSHISLVACKRFAIAICLAFALMGSMPSWARAAIGDDTVEHYDARVQGYTPDVELKSGGVAMMWVLMILMMVVCVSVLFKDAKRSHLD
jgi:hypothetical protein